MGKILTFLVATCCAVVLAGCSATQIHINSTAFHGKNADKRGTIQVVPFTEKQFGSLEFESVRALLEARLTANGYQVVDANAEFIAFITYGISDGQTYTSQIPLYGQTGGGTTTYSGTVNAGGEFGTFSGSSYQMPTYGQIGSVTQVNTVYRREVNVDIAKNIADGEVEKTFELRGVSSGSCGNIFTVLPFILDGMFENFPGTSGVPKKTVIIPKGLSC